MLLLGPSPDLRLNRHRLPLLSLFLSLYLRTSLTLLLIADDFLHRAGRKVPVVASKCRRRFRWCWRNISLGFGRSFFLFSTPLPLAHISRNLNLSHCLWALARLRLATLVPTRYDPELSRTPTLASSLRAVRPAVTVSSRMTARAAGTSCFSGSPHRLEENFQLVGRVNQTRFKELQEDANGPRARSATLYPTNAWTGSGLASKAVSSAFEGGCWSSEGASSLQEHT